MRQKFNSSYDSEGDVLSAYRKNAKVKESIEVSDLLVIDIDKDNQLVGLELLDAHKFLNKLNSRISKKKLLDVKDIELEAKNFRNYWIITLFLKYNQEIIEEKLPAFSTTEFKSPLIASVSA